MRLTENPILHTHARLATRQGLHLLLGAAVIGAMGAALLFLDARGASIRHGREAGLVSSAYVSLLVLQATAAGLGILLVAHVVSTHRTAGILDANRLTPMNPADLAVGYWLGPLLIPLAMLGVGTAFAAFLGVSSPAADLAVMARTQALVWTTTLLGGLVAAWVALAVQNPARAVPIVFLGGIGALAGVGLQEQYIGNLLVGLPAFAEAMTLGRTWSHGWTNEIFGLDLDGVAVAIGLQALAAVACWTAVTTKLRDPQRRSLSRAATLAVFSGAVVVQFLLIHDTLASAAANNNTWRVEEMSMALYAFAVFAAVVAAATTAARSSDLRRVVLAGATNMAQVQRVSSVPLAIALGAVTTGVLLVVPGLEVGASIVASGDALACALLVAAALEAGRYTESRRAGVVVFLLLSATVAVPVLLAIIIDDDLVGAIPGLSGALVLDGPSRSVGLASGSVIAHIVLALVAVRAWYAQGRAAIARARAATT